MPYVWIAVALFIAISSGTAGFKIARNACEAGKAESMRAAEAARRVDESFSQGVSAAYEGVAAQLRRLSAVNRVELTREVQKIEYRCGIPEEGQKIIKKAIDDANSAQQIESEKDKKDTILPSGIPSEGAS
jgi:acetyl-CoA acetyltransferase